MASVLENVENISDRYATIGEKKCCQDGFLVVTQEKYAVPS